MSIDDNDYELTNNRVLDDNKSQLTRFMNTQFFSRFNYCSATTVMKLVSYQIRNRVAGWVRRCEDD